MENKKITKKDKFEMLLGLSSVQENEMLMEFIQKEIDMLERKSSGKSSKKQEKTNAFLDILLAEVKKAFEPNVEFTVSELIRKSSVMGTYSTQKISPYLGKLVEQSKLEDNNESKKHTFWYVA